MTSEPDLEKSKAATLEGLLDQFADHLEAASFEELVTDPKWRDWLKPRHDLDSDGKSMGPCFLPALADDAFEISLALAETTTSVRAERPELAELLDHAVALAYRVGRLITMAELTEGDGSVLALAERGRKADAGWSSGAEATNTKRRAVEALLRDYWSKMAEDVYAPSSATEHRWTLTYLATLIIALRPLAPKPKCWDDLTDWQQKLWETNRKWDAKRIAQQLEVTARRNPDGWTFGRLPIK